MDQEVNRSSPETPGRPAQGSSEWSSNRRSESQSFEKEFEKTVKEVLEFVREFLCFDDSQRATGQSSKGTLSNRATRTKPGEPIRLVNELFNELFGGSELESSEKKSSESAKLREFDFGVLDLADSNDISRVSYNRFHVTYNCDSGEIALKTPAGFPKAYESFKEKVELIEKIFDRIEFLSKPHSTLEHILNFLGELKDNAKETAELSQMADLTPEIISGHKVQDENSFARGLVDWPSFRTERVALSGANTVCNMPDFKSPGIDRTFK